MNDPRALLLLAVLSLSGCGGLASLRTPLEPFGGVRYHVAAMRGQLCGCKDLFMPSGSRYWLLAPFTLPGLANAVALDLLLLPAAALRQPTPAGDGSGGAPAAGQPPFPSASRAD
ncbi:MAG: hypothetical protein KIT58_18525 [Planctomycetota bacterium]|nr:hypothetical protein [Planctomycetota bacterium]